MVYGYARVSTKGQAKDGNSLEAQEQALKQAGAENICCDSFTGKSLERPKFTELIGNLQAGDTLICCKLDRFARTCGKALELIDTLMKKGVTIRILDPAMEFSKAQNDPMNKCFRTILLAFAELERNLIVQRTQEGKAIARAQAEERGEKFIEGRPVKYDEEKLNLAMELLKTNSYTKVSKLTGISKSTLTRCKRARKSMSV